MADKPEYLTYNLEQRILVDYDGQTYPIIKMFDDEGDETDDIEECRAFVAGVEGYYVSVAVEETDERLKPS